MHRIFLLSAGSSATCGLRGLYLFLRLILGMGRDINVIVIIER